MPDEDELSVSDPARLGGDELYSSSSSFLDTSTVTPDRLHHHTSSQADICSHSTSTLSYPPKSCPLLQSPLAPLSAPAHLPTTSAIAHPDLPSLAAPASFSRSTCRPDQPSPLPLRHVLRRRSSRTRRRRPARLSRRVRAQSRHSSWEGRRGQVRQEEAVSAEIR